MHRSRFVGRLGHSNILREQNELDLLKPLLNGWPGCRIRNHRGGDSVLEGKLRPCGTLESVGSAPATTSGFQKQRAVFLAVLGLIAALALVMRIYRLADIPNGFHVDEASIGYNARCILETGRDEHGEFLPLFFRAFGEYKNPVFIYACAPVIGLLGPDVFSVRLTSALFGAMTVFATGLLGAALLSRWCGVIAATLLAFSPWHFQFSRIAFEAISLPLFITLAVWLLILAERRPRLLVAAAVPFAIAIYCYAIAKLFVPLLLVGFMVLRWRWLGRNRCPAIIAAALLLVLLLPSLVLTVQGRVQARFNHLYIGTHPSTLEQGSTTWKGTFLGRHGPHWLRESQAGATAAVFAGNYSKHLSLDFLLRHGDTNPRHNPGGGMLSRTELGAAVLGVIALGIGFRRWSNAFILWWLVIAPIPASLTALGIPHAIRTISLLPLPQVLAAVGICFAASIERRWWRRVSSTWRRPKTDTTNSVSWLVRTPLITVLVIACVWPVDVGRHLTWYFEVFPVEVWRPFFWEENAVSKVIRDRTDIRRFFIGSQSQRLYDVTLLFMMDIPPRKWLADRRLEQIVRRDPNLSEMGEGSAVFCRPGDPRYSNLKLLGRIVDPQGRPSIDLRTTTSESQDDQRDNQHQ
jgi:4-amino-4-deoxy-L-arabinose transferase-like glycosyltransferase